jgi:hypothetical protein
MALIPKQLAILNHIVAHLEGINPDNIDPATNLPYEMDLRGSVYLGRTTLGADVNLPALAINEPPVPADSVFADDGNVKQVGKWRNLLQGFAEKDMENPSVPGYKLKAIVEQRLSRMVQKTNGKPTFPQEHLPARFGVQALKVHQGVVRGPDEKVSSTGFFYIPLTLDMATDMTNPYVEETTE